MRDDCLHCTSCGRTPVPGEFVHWLEAGKAVCSLCLADVPASRREGAVPERVHANERHVAVVRRAA